MRSSRVPSGSHLKSLRLGREDFAAGRERSEPRESGVSADMGDEGGDGVGGAGWKVEGFEGFVEGFVRVDELDERFVDSGGLKKVLEVELDASGQWSATDGLSSGSE